MMASSEERKKILQMIQDGKITADDGAKLLAALSQGRRRRPNTSSRVVDSRYMRVRVTDTFSGKTKVSVNLPLGLVDAGLNIAANFMPDLGENTALEIGNAIREGLTGKIVDVFDEEDGEHIEIFIE
jgi:hypothetical protein